MAVNLVPKGITDPEVRIFLQQLTDTQYIAPIKLDPAWTTQQALEAIVAKVNELVKVNNSYN